MAWINAPVFVDRGEDSDMLATAMEEGMLEISGHNPVVYLDVDQENFAGLAKVFSPTPVKPWNERPPEDPVPAGMFRIGDRSDYVRAEVRMRPLWRSAFISVGWGHVGCTKFIMQIGSRPRTIAEHCIIY